MTTEPFPFLKKNGERVASLATVEGRVYPTLEPLKDDYNPQEWYFEDDEWEWITVILTRDGDDFYLNITCEKQVSEQWFHRRANELVQHAVEHGVDGVGSRTWMEVESG
jgi:hypothetical protein